MSINILVLNCGSSSIKFQVLQMPDENLLAKGAISEIGGRTSKFTIEFGEEKVTDMEEILDHQYGVKKILDNLILQEIPGIHSMNDIHGIGHRTVHGAEFFNASVKIDNEVMNTLYECIDFAPLHNPANIKGIEAARKVLPEAVHVAVFDTAYHAQMPAMAYRYALPKYFYDKHKIRRYGFHGTSHRYVSQEAAKLLQKDYTSSKYISAHLGNGCSMTAIENGVSVDTSMGFTPLEGLVMGTRVGDIDPAVLLMIMGREELTKSELNTLLNKHSGLLGISGVSSDMAQVMVAAQDNNKDAQLAMDMFAYRVKKYFGSYLAVLGGADALIFTGGIGENAPIIRQMALAGLDSLGYVMSDQKNNAKSREMRSIAADDSPKEILVVPTNEELVITRDTFEIIQQT